MATSIFVNIPVKDLEKSKSFYTALGYSINPDYTNENAACVVISDVIYLMILVEPFFKTFTRKELADATKTTEAIICISVDSREAVDTMVKNALANGGSASNDASDMVEMGMYFHSFQDPDGHLWEVMYSANNGGM